MPGRRSRDATLEAFGERVADVRIAAEMTQAQLAKIVGLARSSIANIEAGAQEPGIETIAAIAKACGVTVDTLVGTEKMHHDPLPWIELARRVIASEREHRKLADDYWTELEAIKAAHARGIADGLEIAREHHLELMAQLRAVDAGRVPGAGDAA